MSRLPSPLRAVGKHKAEWLSYQRMERAAVMIRCRGFCEGCGKRTVKLEGAHIFGRRNIVGEPWASSRHLMAALCCYDLNTNQVGCHEKIDRYLDKPLRARLEQERAAWFYQAHKARYPKSLDPAGAVRKLAAKLDKEAA